MKEYKKKSDAVDQKIKTRKTWPILFTKDAIWLIIILKLLLSYDPGKYSIFV